MDFLKPAKYFFAVSTILSVICLVLIVYPGPRLSIEFTGGTRMEVAVQNPEVTPQSVLAAVQKFNPDLSATVNKTQQGNYLIRMRGINNKQHKKLLAHLKTELKDAQEVQYTTIGPTVGASLKRRAAMAVLVASLGIVLYLAWAFRTVPRKYSPWKFGIIAVATLLHDVLLTVGIFVVLSYYTNFELDTLFITALLTILGYSVNNTIVIFDRIRDNLYAHDRKQAFSEIANQSVNQVWKRSCFTGMATLIMLLSIFFFGGESIRWFVLTLIIGIILGTYSSIFVATPLLVLWNRRQK